MTYKALCAQYNLSEQEAALCRGADSAEDVSDAALERASVLLLLRDAGVDFAGIRSFLNAQSCSCGLALQKRILRTARDALLDSIHEKQRVLDKIDCLLCRLEKSIKEEAK